MNKELKTAAIGELTERVVEYENLYITDSSALNVAEVNNLRRICFDKGIKFQVVKNTILRQALQSHGDKYKRLLEVLHGPTSVMLSNNANDPAKVIKQFSSKNDKGKPSLKAAYVGEDIFIGAENLDALVSLKSKNELIGEILTLLQSPATNVISALLSGGNKLAGIVKTLSEKPE